MSSKKQDQKKKERERRVARKKLEDAARLRAAVKKTDDSETATGTARSRKVLTSGIKQLAQGQTQSHKPSVSHRRTGG